MIFSKFVIYLIHCYRASAPVLRSMISVPFSCRYEPSCSEYAEIAVREFGLVKGLWRSVRRLASCHPLSEGGWDPPVRD